MDHIEARLNHMRNTIARFSDASFATLDVQRLKAQISLRSVALRDIRVIRCRLGPGLRKSCEDRIFISKPANRRRRIWRGAYLPQGARPCRPH
jgi:hypothetical protein